MRSLPQKKKRNLDQSQSKPQEILIIHHTTHQTISFSTEKMKKEEKRKQKKTTTRRRRWAEALTSAGSRKGNRGAAATKSDLALDKRAKANSYGL